MKKGFTLIELLAVIAILVIILIIAIPQILDIVENSKINAYINNNKIVLKSAQLFITKNNEYLPTIIGNTVEIEIEQLITQEYISNFKVGNNECDGYVLITKTATDSYDYTPHINCTNPVSNSAEDGLIGHWKLDGNVFDYSANSNHGTIYGNPEVIEGINGLAYNFTGEIATYIRANSALPATSWTISLWVKKNAHTVSNYPIFMSFSLPYIACSGSTSPFRLSYSAPTQVNTSGTTIPILGKWYHIVATSNIDGTRLYVDGKLEGINTTNIATNAGGNFDLGRHYGSDTYRINGSIDDVRIYNRVLSDQEIKMLYQLQK